MITAPRLRYLAILTYASAQLLLFKPNTFAQEPERLSPDAILREINLARENPRAYAAFVQKSRPFHMIEHGRAVDEAVRFLTKARPLDPLKLSPGMSHAAADHCSEQAGGEMGHSGAGHTSPGDRLNRYGSWLASYGENISYGRKTSREVVVALIIDDGTRSRGHRKNIFNSKFTVAGVATGSHARFGTICTTDFAGAYAERGEALVAHNP